MEKVIMNSNDSKSIDYTEQELRERLSVSTTLIQDNGYQKPTPDKLSAIKEAGIDFIELLELRDQFDFGNVQQMKEMHAMFSDAGIQVGAFHCYQTRLQWETEEEHTQIVDRCKSQIDALVMMGGRVWGSHTFIEETTAKKGLEELLQYIEDKDVTLVVENFNNDTQTPPEIVEFTSKLRNPQIGVLLDTGHCINPDGPQYMTIAGTAGQMIRDCGKHLRHLHLHDFRLDVDKTDGHRAPFDGDIRWIEIMRALKEIGYPGYFNFEPTPRSFEEIPDFLSKIGAFPEKLCKRAKAGP